MQSTLDAATPMFAKIRHVISGLLAVAGTLALILMAVRQYNVRTAHVDELWFVGVMVAITFEAIANFLRPAAVGPKISIWSLTLTGCSCMFGGFVMKHGFVVALGGAMIAGAYVLAVFVPNTPSPATSDNAAR
jgi:hypothetical protein